MSTVVLAVVCASSAMAHMMPAQQGTLNVLDNAVFTVLSLPLSAFPGNDDNGDGRLSSAEVLAHAAAMQVEIPQRVRLYDGANVGRADFVQVSAEHDERDSLSNAGSTHMLVLMKVSFDAPPRALRIEADVWGMGVGERQLTIKATRGKDVEAVVLSPRRNSHRFFSAPGAVLRDYIVIGAQHILLGADHLLFLMTIIVAAAGWRYWLVVLTSFTIAHSITLTMSLLGLVHVSAAIVEPLIAVSIVLMALLNLRQRAAVPAQRMAIVFLCGLLHGLGFASSIADMGLNGANRLMSIVGFNIGIELGQALFVCTLLATLWAASTLWLFTRGSSQRVRTIPCAVPLRAARVASVCAALLGMFWLVQRLGTSAQAVTQAAVTSRKNGRS